MRRITLIAAVLILMLTGAVYASRITDNSNAFSVVVPSEWSQVSTDDLLSLEGPNHLPQMTVSSQEAGGVTLDLFAPIYEKELKKEISSLSILSYKEVEVDGEEAGVWTCLANEDNVFLKFRNYVIFHDDTIYTVVFVGLENSYDEDVRDYKSIMNSWRWE